MIFKVEDVIVVQIQNVILSMQFRIADCLVLKSYFNVMLAYTLTIVK